MCPDKMCFYYYQRDNCHIAGIINYHKRYNKFSSIKKYQLIYIAISFSINLSVN